MATVNVNLADGTVATVDDRAVSRIYETDSQVFAEVPTNGASPLILESGDNLATTVALFSNFVTVPSVKGDYYLAIERFDLLDIDYDAVDGTKFVYNLNEEGDTFEATSTQDIATFVALLGNIVTISTEDGDIYLNKDRVSTITRVDDDNCRIIYKSLFGFYDKVFYANESRSDVKAKIDAL